MDNLFELNEKDFDLLHEVPVCGCGTPGVVWELYRAQLNVTPLGGGLPGYSDEDDFPFHEERVAAAQGNEALFYVVAYVLDHIEATEHGGNISGAWLTEKGLRLRGILDRYAEAGWDAMPCHSVT